MNCELKCVRAFGSRVLRILLLLPSGWWGIFLGELNNFYYSLPKVKELDLTKGEGSLKILIG